MRSGVRAGGAVVDTARLAPNAVSMYFPVVVLGGGWWVGLAAVAVFLVVVAGASLGGSATERAVRRALRSGERSGVSWALVDTEAERRLAGSTGPRFWVLLGLTTAVVLVLWVTVGGLDPTPARATGAALLVLSSAPAAWGEWVLRSQAARWLAAADADQRVPGGAAGPS